MNTYTIRQAHKSDCGVIAQLYRLSSDGVADYIWTKWAQPGEDLLEVGRRRYEQEDSVFSYRNCLMVERHGEAAGMLVAFPMRSDPGYIETDPVLAPYSRLEDDGSYYICGMAVFPDHQGGGIGSRLLALAEQRAREGGFGRLSLVVFEENEGAARLYRRKGFEEIAREPVSPHPLIRHGGDALLMVKEVAGA